MYKLVNGQLLNIIEVVTPNQIALVTTTAHSVVGYDSAEPIEIESIPERNDVAGKDSALHYINGELQWVYTDRPLTLEEQVTILKIRLAMAEQSAAETSTTLQEMLEVLIDMEVI